ncbi:DUF1871 family protein [Candidatus Parcubacteria bacterium]|nr:MAG: DUF1871 family protein [Candidatus Parcubacteria bacterium]
MLAEQKLAEGIRQLLLKHDPIFAVTNVAEQRDEYKLEIPQVLAAVMSCQDPKTLRKELRKIFSKTVGTFEAGTRWRYRRLARELLALKENLGHGGAEPGM